MNHRFRKYIVVPTLCMSILAASPTPLLAASFTDSNTHWATEAIEIWADYGVIQGFEGEFRPDDTITRGELAVIINRIMNYPTAAENTFTDLADGAWYTDAILKLANQGIMKGFDGQMRPEDPVTREETLVMMARALQMKPSNGKAVSFEDMDSVSDWARDAVQAMAENGFIHGFEDGTFRPGENMSRAGSVTVINNTIKGFYNQPGTYQASEALNGYVIVASDGVVLEGMTINGNLLLTPSVTSGEVTLKNTTVSGEQIVIEGNGSSETPTPPGSEDGDNDDNNGDSGDNNGGGSGGGGSTGGGGGGGSTYHDAADNDIVVSSTYADRTGKVTSGSKRYTIGQNAFDTLEKAVAQAQALGKETTITLLSDLQLEQTVEIHADQLTLLGKGHTLTYAAGVKDGIQIVQRQGVVLENLTVKMQDETGKWNGSYGIQAYESDVTLNNITATGADAGILVNGAAVKLGGIVDVSGNEFGGIEVSKGTLAESNPSLTGSAENLKNDTEEIGKPTVWIDKVSELTEAVVNVSGLHPSAVSEKDQMHYFLNGSLLGVQSVGTLEQLEGALADETVNTIQLTADIASDKTLEITRPVILMGTDVQKTISFENKNGFQIVNAGDVTLENIKLEVTGQQEGWQGLYALQVYGASQAVIRNIAATGADGGILVNGAAVTLEGIVDVSGNEFGGIEVSKGTLVESNPSLTGSSENLKNDTESTGKPTVWIDKVSELTEAVVNVSGLYTVATEKDQLHLYLSETDVKDLSELEAALSNSQIKVIHVTSDIASDKTLEITRPVILMGADGQKTISFENKNGFQIVNAGDVTLENIKLEVTGQQVGWNGLYALQAYGASNVVVNNVTATGADGGILVNGAAVTLEGIVDVSGNEFGGIEVSKGAMVESNPSLIGSSENLKNDTEEAGKPTIWIDKLSELTSAVVNVTGVNESEVSEKDQMHYFLGEVPSLQQ